MAELLHANPSEPWVDHIKGFLRSEFGDQEQAVTFLRRAVRRLPSESEPKVTLGIALMRNGDLAEAEKMQEEALATEPDSFLALTNLACVLVTREKSLVRAEHLIRRAGELEPEDEVVWGTLGRALALQGKQAEADQAFLRAIRLDPRGEICRTIALFYPHLAGPVNQRLAELDPASLGIKSHSDQCEER